MVTTSPSDGKPPLMDTTISATIKPRTEEEVKETLSQLRFVEVQAAMQRNAAAQQGDLALVWTMESERVGARIAINSVLWALGLTDRTILDPGVVATYDGSGKSE